jgi:hypothetical protein
MTACAQRLAEITSMSSSELAAAWGETFGEAAPSLPLSLLRRALTNTVQEQAFGGLSVSARKALEAMAARGIAAMPDPPIRLKPGTRLLREWNGRMHSVLVTEGGFQFDGRQYRSLSQIARRITGAHWSGPRFFGLKRPTPPPPRSLCDGQA